MHLPGKVGSALGVAALLLALVGAQALQAQDDKKPPKGQDQGAAYTHLGY